MTADVAPYQAPDEGSGSELVAWAADASAAFRIAQSLVRTSFVPAAYRGKPEEATAAILTGAELSMKPMAALRSIHVINGTPAMAALALRGLVQSAGHELWVTEQTTTRAVVSGRRRGSSEVQTSTWTIDRARRLSLAEKPNWKSQPEAMLVARATAECCRLIASDVLLGLPYAIEELEEHEEPKRTAKRQPLAVVVPEPDVEEPVAEAVAAPEPVSEPAP